MDLIDLTDLERTVLVEALHYWTELADDYIANQPENFKVQEAYKTALNLIYIIGRGPLC